MQWEELVAQNKKSMLIKQQIMYETAVYSPVNGTIIVKTVKRWYYSGVHWHWIHVMLHNLYSFVCQLSNINQWKETTKTGQTPSRWCCCRRVRMAYWL